MIIHPDGRLEGTPEELASYQKAVAKNVCDKVTIGDPPPGVKTTWDYLPPDTLVPRVYGCSQATQN